ncbi:hypothetical protein BJG93_30025 (plasmid) [Paraburkholderia sprentiae WSM5005]|uniref:Uncharacterized protein n=1 Tax=Paraburkholderia sprentiae WSM5005 TaxID=754502 RepID=A0A1I9YU41_9BURK|nr:hypothetical protein [Paraburkholderia sprentiae]APA89710.1 hypothetical protein BJG93_30025 [Paraburkholderia sprentiae WSM5005]
MSVDVAIARYGTTQSREPERCVRAGPWSALLVDGALREIRYRDVEVIRSVALLVRDKDWGTCRPKREGVELDEDEHGFRIAYRAQCANPDGQVLNYDQRIVCPADGALRFEASVTAQDAFLTARCGFCVLHPIDGVAGAPARVEHGDGTHEQSAFPELIDPWQPFKDICAIEHDLACGLTVRCAFAGDVFEMEDQRNWSDASFKTYSRPLALPWPYTLEAGVTTRQSVTLSVEERSGVFFPGSARAPSIPEQNDAVTITLDLVQEAAETMPALGVAIAASEIDAALAHPELLAGLAPQQLTLSFDPVAGHGLAELERFSALQRRAGIAAVLEYALPGVDEPRRELDALAALIEAARLEIVGIVVSPCVHRQSNPPGSISPPCPALDDVYRAARAAFPRLRIGGGMLSYFTELNRKRPPLELADWVTHATCPIVHAADDRSVMQTLEAIPHITRSCRALVGAQRYAIGPVSIGMRQNPYGSRVMPNPHRERMAMAGFDPRQTALFGGAWLAGYAAALEGARIDTLTLGALTGERGLADVSDGVKRYPMYEVARALAAMAGSDRLAVAVAAAERSAIACLAARDAQERIRIVIANLTDSEREVRLTLRGGTVSFHAFICDEKTVREKDVMPVPAQVDLTRPVLLRPYAFVIGMAV